MRIAIHECKHCCVEYHFQWSGSYDAIDVPREYQDEKYCPECKKAIVEALAKITKKFSYKDVQTDEVDLETLLRWEKEHIEDYKKTQEEAAKEGKVMFPMSKRILAGLANLETGERDIVNEVIGREDKKGRIYIYSYWSSDKSRQRISVERRVNLITGEPGKYKLKK